jgi:hypothetical protein
MDLVGPEHEVRRAVDEARLRHGAVQLTAPQLDPLLRGERRGLGQQRDGVAPGRVPGARTDEDDG